VETLLLDQSYRPVARVTWQKAMTLLFTGKIEIVDEYEDRDVRSVSVTFKMPSVVRFLRRAQEEARS